MIFHVLIFVIFASSLDTIRVFQNETISYRNIFHSDNEFVFRKKRQAEACILPPFPRHGSYKVANVQNFKPGQSFNSFILLVGCRRGYGILESEGGIDGVLTKPIYCLNGVWSQNIPKCVRFCTLDPHPSVRYMCNVPGTHGFKLCKKYVSPGTAVNPICNTPIYYSSESFLNMNCKTGFWDYIATCQAECGRVTPKASQLVLGGQAAIRGELPWHVGVYRNITGAYEQICGGTLVSNNIVISAAHCFWQSSRKKLPASEFAIAIGKLYRPWDYERDVGAQQSGIKDIRIPELFDGKVANLQEDIAIVTLTTQFTYKTHVKPVCLNFNPNFDRWQLRNGNMGKVAGWGLTSVNGNSSFILKVLDLPYVSEDICIMALPLSFREYLTGDKFCAGFTDGKSLCQGDSGGGLAFPEKELGVERFYLRGIVSAAPKLEGQLCNDISYTTFTKITKHELFIKESMLAANDKTCPWYQFQCGNGDCVDQGADCNGYQECADGSDESDDLCKPDIPELDISSTTTKPVCILPAQPSHGKYQILGEPSAKPGQVLQTFILSVQCDEGYAIKSENEASKNKTTIYCVNGEWYQTMPVCEKFCKLIPNPSVTYLCRISGSSELKPCEDDLPPGALVKPECRTPNYISEKPFPDLKCENGSWDHSAWTCNPVCGLPTPEGTPLIIGGRTARRGELPWHVGIYTKKKQPYMQICGGTIVTATAVISAAHCFWNDVKGQLSASDYLVGAGKLFRTLSDVEDTQQISDIKQIKMPNQFHGAVANFQSDISVLILETALVFKQFVRPICISFDATFNREQLQEDNLGKVTGWGLTEANGDPSIVLNVLEMPYISYQKCFSAMPLSFREYLTSDKFCAGYTNGSALCKFDSGGGIVFYNNGNLKHYQRYYLRGVISTAPTNEDLCNAYTYTTMQSILNYKEFILENINDLVLAQK